MSVTVALGSDEMLAAGITYRQLDYWSRKGWLRPAYVSPGSGRQRRFPCAEQQIARVMVLLIHAGVEPEAAARAAREGVELGLPYGRLNDSVAVMWVDDGSPVDRRPTATDITEPSAAEVDAAYAGLERLFEEVR